MPHGGQTRSPPRLRLPGARLLAGAFRGHAGATVVWVRHAGVRSAKPPGEAASGTKRPTGAASSAAHSSDGAELAAPKFRRQRRQSRCRVPEPPTRLARASGRCPRVVPRGPDRRQRSLPPPGATALAVLTQTAGKGNTPRWARGWGRGGHAGPTGLERPKVGRVVDSGGHPLSATCGSRVLFQLIV